MSNPSFIPPEELIGYVATSLDPDQFLKLGNEFFNYFREYGDLQPTDRVLDIGCGCARMALPLIPYLGTTGSYEGIDVHAKSIEWASKTITPHHPNFRFQRTDVSNTTYNPSGESAAHNYRLPFADNEFDFVFLASVFTHMLPATLFNYLREISRVLKINGRCFATFFIMNEKIAQAVRAGETNFPFTYRYKTCAVRDRDRPEDAVAHDEHVVRKFFANCGLVPTHPALYGRWADKKNGQTFQDAFVVRKERQPGLIQRMWQTWAAPKADVRPVFKADPKLARAAA